MVILSGQVAIARPKSLAELGEVVAKANSVGQIVTVKGGGTKSNFGAPVENLDLVIETGALSALDHAKDDQTIVVGAGMNFSKLQNQLAKSGQRISLDPPDRGGKATIGGILATADCGPLRYRFGSPRELIIGVRIAGAEGAIAHAGGKVIKNVAGFDLAKLSVGSFGTLGVIGEAAFRLHPLPESRLTFTVEIDPSTALSAMSKILKSQIEPSAVEYGLGKLTILIEGTEKGAKVQLDALVKLLATEAYGAKLEMTESIKDAAIWEHLATARSDTRSVGARIATRVSHLAKIHEAATRCSGKIKVAVLSHAGSGIHDIIFSGEGSLGDYRSALDAFRNNAAYDSQPLSVRFAPPQLEELVDLIGIPVPSSVKVMQRVKASMDPNGRLAPGRFRPWW